LWRLNNPNGTPSDKITLIDHYGNSHTTIFIGQFPELAIAKITFQGVPADILGETESIKTA